MMTGTKYQVQVTNMERFEQAGNLKAFADVKIGKSLRVYGFRVVQQPGQKAWVSPPQRTWDGQDGKKKYSPIVELSGELKAEVDEAILAEWANS